MKPGISFTYGLILGFVAFTIPFRATAVAADAPAGLAYSVSPAIYPVGVAIAYNEPSSTGSAVDSYSITPSLPAGLSLDTATGVISGTPAELRAATDYTVTATNSEGSATTTVRITVSDGAPGEGPVLQQDHFDVAILGLFGGVNVSVVDGQGFSEGTHGQRVTDIFLAKTNHARLMKIGGWGRYRLNGRTLLGINAGGYIKHALEHDEGIFWSATDSSPLYSQQTAGLWFIEGNRAFFKQAREFANWMQYQNTLFIRGLENSGAVSSDVPLYCDDFDGEGSWGWIPPCGAFSDYIAHSGVGIANTIFVGAIDTRFGDTTATGAIRADGVFAPHTIYVESESGSTSQATPVLAAYATNLAFANPTWGAARLKQELIELSREEVIDYRTGASNSDGVSLVESRTIKAIRPAFAPEPFSHEIAITEGGLDGDEPTVVDGIFGEDALAYSDRTHQHNGAAFNDDGVLDKAGGNIVPLPSYLVGSPYYRFANNARENAGYVGQLTSDVECYWYLLIDNRLDGPNGARKQGNSNTGDAILGGTLQWVIDGGWQRVNTGISPNGQADYTGLDEGGNAVGPGLGLNQFFGVWVLPNLSTSATVNGNGISGSNMISVVAAQLPPTPANLTYSANPAVYAVGVAITDNVPSSTGGAVVSYSITPSLPAGLSLDTASGVISGTPTELSAVTDYTVTATNTGGSATVTVSITVNDVAPSALSYATNSVIYTKDVGITDNTPSSAGGAVVSYSITPSLPTGLSFDTTTGVISGTPSALSTATSYVVSATNSGGSATVTLRIAVNDVKHVVILLEGTDGSRDMRATFNGTGSWTTAYFTFRAFLYGDSNVANSSDASLGSSSKEGFQDGQITGGNAMNAALIGDFFLGQYVAFDTPIAMTAGAAPTSFNVIGFLFDDDADPSVDLDDIILVTDQPESNTWPPDTEISYTVGASTTFSLDSGVGATFDQAFNKDIYTLDEAVVGSLKVAETVAPAELAYSANSAVYTVGAAITDNEPSSTGSAVDSYSITPSLPAGLSLDTASGVISGTPTELSAVTDYTVTATNPGGSATVTLRMTVNDVQHVVILLEGTDDSRDMRVTFNGTGSWTTSGSTVSAFTHAASNVANSSDASLGGSGKEGFDDYSITGGNAMNAALSGSFTGGQYVALTTSIAMTADAGPSSFNVIGLLFDDDSDPIAGQDDVILVTDQANTSSWPSGTEISYTVGASTTFSLDSGVGATFDEAFNKDIYTLNDGVVGSLKVAETVAPAELDYSANPAVYTVGLAITDNVPSSTGSAVDSYSITPSLPAGLSLDTSSGVISGTPTALSAATDYTVTATNSGGSATVTVSITVNDVAPSALNYATNPAIYTKGVAITDNVPSSTGGDVVSYSITPSLPSGLSLSTSSGVISGTPTELSAATDYTITATNTGGSATVTVSITVNDVAPSALSYATNSVIYTKDVGITDNTNTPSSAGGAVVSYSITPSLPAGLSLDTASGVISGTPTELSAVTDYTVTATNTGGSATVTVSITVNDVAPSALSYATNSVIYTKDVGITDNTPSSAGGAVVSYSITPSLPTGLSFDTTTGVISGTPSALSTATSYVVSATNSGGSATVTLRIAVNDVKHVVILLEGTDGSRDMRATFNGTGSWTTAYFTFRAFLYGDSNVANSSDASLGSSSKEGFQDGQITGGNAMNAALIGDFFLGQYVAFDTPIAMTASAAPTSFNVIGFLFDDDADPSVGLDDIILVTDQPESNTWPPDTEISYTVGASTTFSLDSGVGATFDQAFNKDIYTLGEAVVGSLKLDETVPPADLDYSANSAVYTVGAAITDNEPSSTGSAVDSYSITPSLPAGLSLDTASGVISGTPTALSATTDYTVTATNSGGSAAVTVSMTVNDVAPAELSYATNPAVYTVGMAISDNAPSSTGGAVVSYSIDSALPAGLSFDTASGVISGTPTELSAATDYAVTATNSGGAATVTVRITVNDVAPSELNYATNPAIYTKDVAITDNVPSSTGGDVVSYSITPSLPAGLSLSTSSGVISGTPTELSAATSYTVTATNSGGSTTVTLRMTVNDAKHVTILLEGTDGSRNMTVTFNGTGSWTTSGPTVSAFTYGDSNVANSSHSSLIGSSREAVADVSIGNAFKAAISSGYSDGQYVPFDNPIAFTTPAGSPDFNAIGFLFDDDTQDSDDIKLVTNRSSSRNWATGTTVSYTVGSSTTFSLDARVGADFGGAMNVGIYTLNDTLDGTLQIAVAPDAPDELAYSANPAIYTKDVAITDNEPSSTGGDVVSYSITPSLPAGLSLSTSSGVISGTPTELSAATDYTVKATNSGGSATVTVRITVNDVAPSELNYATNPAIYAKGVTITDNEPSSTGGDVVSYSIAPSLPAGLSLDTGSGVISGTPTELSAATDYTVKATNSGGSATVTVSIAVHHVAPLRIIVEDAAPSALSYAMNPATYTAGEAITDSMPSSTGGAVVAYSITPVLPAGLSLDTGSGVISGTPAEPGEARKYTVTATNSGGSTTAVVTITVKGRHPQYTNSGPFNVAENSVNGTLAGDADANDAAGGAKDVGVTYAVQSGNDSVDGDATPAFGLDPDTGVLTVRDQDDLDHETQSSFALVIRATDGDGFTDVIVTIQVDNVPEAPVSTGLAPVHVMIGATDSVIDLATAFSDEEDADLSYSISSNSNTELFTSVGIDEETDRLILDFAPNIAGKATLEITATDSDGQSVSASLVVTVSGDAVEEWRDANFSAADLGDPAKEATLWGNSANPDEDLWSNAFEFFFGTDPNSFDEGYPMTYEVRQVGLDGFAVLEFERSKAVPAGVGVVEGSGDLSQWQVVRAPAVVMEDLGDRERVRVRIPLEEQAKQSFVRLVVDLGMN